MSISQQVNFARLAGRVKEAEYGKQKLSIWGGQCAEKDMAAFLAGWSLQQMPFRIWEYASEIVFDRDLPPRHLALLERGRLFGEGGDLELRRDAAGFRWRFVGAPGIQPPAGDYSARDYWADPTHAGMAFCRSEETVLLWGARDQNGQWKAGRVAAAKLSYPATGQRIQLHYSTFSRAGRVAFVWFTGLSAWANGQQQDAREGKHVEA